MSSFVDSSFVDRRGLPLSGRTQIAKCQAKEGQTKRTPPYLSPTHCPSVLLSSNSSSIFGVSWNDGTDNFPRISQAHPISFKASSAFQTLVM